jgi:hypothetical protein
VRSGKESLLVVDCSIDFVGGWTGSRIRSRTRSKEAVSSPNSSLRAVDANFCSNKSVSSAVGNTLNPAYLSKSGAFNGTGLAIASYSFATGGYGVINVYFQHWSGQLRKMQLMSDGSWQGGDSTNIVATDARNATPISAVAYAMDQKSTVSFS